MKIQSYVHDLNAKCIRRQVELYHKRLLSYCVNNVTAQIWFTLK